MALTDKQRLARAEAAINGLAFLETRLAAIPRGLCPELDEIRREYAGRVSAFEQRPYSAPEQREAVSA